MTRSARGDRGLVLASVLLLSLAMWVVLLGVLSTAFLHYRQAIGAERGAIAAAAARRAADGYLSAAAAARERDGAWPAMVDGPLDEGACVLELEEWVPEDTWYRVRVRAEFEDALAWQEGTVHVRR